MSREDYGLAFFTILILGIVAYLMTGVFAAVSQVLAALIGFAGIVVGAVIRYATEVAKNRQQQMAIVRQQNYQKLLEKIGEFARNQKEGRNPLTVAHIESWVFGDKAVVEKTSLFLREPTQNNLKELLITMRSSMNLSDLQIDEDGIKILFPTETHGFQHK